MEIGGDVLDVVYWIPENPKSVPKKWQNLAKMAKMAKIVKKYVPHQLTFQSQRKDE